MALILPITNSIKIRCTIQIVFFVYHQRSKCFTILPRLLFELVYFSDANKFNFANALKTSIPIYIISTIPIKDGERCNDNGLLKKPYI